jgi:hypothetical protein
MNARRNALLLCGLVIALITVAAFTVRRTGLGAQESPDPKAEIKHQRREARYNVDPYLSWKNRITIPFSTRHDGSFNDTHISYGELGDINDPAVLAKLKNDELLERQQHICAADVIVKGEVVKSVGVIAEDDKFIYTVYTLAITEVIRAKSGMSLSSDDMIQFTSPGGTAIVKGDDGTKSVTYNYPLIANLKVNTQYILYLARDEQADDYYVMNQYGVFVIEGRDKVTRMDAYMAPFYRERHRYLEAPTAMPAISNAVQSAVCK